MEQPHVPHLRMLSHDRQGRSSRPWAGWSTGSSTRECKTEAEKTTTLKDAISRRQRPNHSTLRHNPTSPKVLRLGLGGRHEKACLDCGIISGSHIPCPHVLQADRSRANRNDLGLPLQRRSSRALYPATDQRHPAKMAWNTSTILQEWAGGCATRRVRPIPLPVWPSRQPAQPTS
jgi:hypothetical protein